MIFPLYQARVEMKLCTLVIPRDSNRYILHINGPMQRRDMRLHGLKFTQEKPAEVHQVHSGVEKHSATTFCPAELPFLLVSRPSAMSQNHSYAYDVTDHSLLDELFRACDGGSQVGDHAVSVRRRAGLQPMRLYCVGRHGGRGAAQSLRLHPGRDDFQRLLKGR